MRPTATHIKLGLLTVLGAAALLVAALVLGLRARDVDVYHTYFDESVHGLERGAMVKFRGVRIGKVAGIRVAPGKRLIEVELAIEERHARDLELEQLKGDLRARLVLFGVTGVKLVDLDFAGPDAPPAAALPFPPPARYIPSRPSLLGQLSGDIEALAARMPVLLDEAHATIKAFKIGIDEGRRLIGDARTAIAAIGRVARTANRANVPRALATTLATIDELGRSTADAASELEHTARDIGDAARSMQDFLEALERDPDMLLKGRRRTP